MFSQRTDPEAFLRQLLYASTSTAPPGRADLDSILEASRHNNAIDGITGLLWSDGTRFIQALEGDDDSIDAAFTRISADPRHIDVHVLSDRTIEMREFGSWTMELRPRGAGADGYDARVERLLIAAPPAIRDQFRTMVGAC